MRVLNTYLTAWRTAFSEWKLWCLLYLLNFCFALVVSYPAFQFLNDKLAHSMALDKIADQFDYTVFNDILNEYGEVIDFISSQGILTALLFLLLSVFLVGGILNRFRINSINNIEDDSRSFWNGGANYYWRIFFLTLIFLVLQALILFLFISLFNYLTDGGLERFHSEASIYRRAVITFVIYSIVACIFWVIQDYAKVIMVRENSSLFNALGRAIKFVFKNFGGTMLLYLLNLLTFGLVFWVYWRTPGISSILIAFILGQVILVFRIGTKLLNLASATHWYETSRISKAQK